MKNLLTWLNKPYPFLEDPTLKLALSMLIGLICFLFLLIFRPFGLSQVEEVSYIFGFGVIGCAVLVVHYFIFPLIWKNFFREDGWNIGKQLLFYTSIIIFIGCLISLYNSTVGRQISPQYGTLTFIGFALAVGVLPMLFMTYFTEKVAASRNLREAQSIVLSKSIGTQLQTITLQSKNQGESDLILKMEDFLFAKAAGNYVEIHYLDEGQCEKRLLRLSLRDIEEQTDHLPDLLRCHKSYLVNKKKISAVKGNARSLVLELTDLDESIPVSRSLSRKELEQ